MGQLIRARSWISERRAAAADKKHGQRKMAAYVAEALESGQLKPEDFSIREAFAGLVDDGLQVMEDMREDTEYTREAAVNTSLFSTITKSVLAQQVKDSFMLEEFVLGRLIPTETARMQGEVLPGFTPIGDRAEIVAEGDEYPLVNFNEDWERMPIAYKKGMIIPITREAVLFDRTNQILQIAAGIGEWLGVQREKEIADTIIDNPRGSATGGMGNRLEWRGTQYATYDTGTNWTNSHQNVLTDYTDIENSEKLLDDMVEPYTGEPVVMGGRRTLLCMPSKWYTAVSLGAATELRDGTNPVTIRPNPYQGLDVQRSRFLYRRVINGGNAGVAVSAANAAVYWYWGDFNRAFAWREHMPLTVEQQGPGSGWDFSRDILTSYKARYMGTARTKQPRAIIRSTN